MRKLTNSRLYTFVDTGYLHGRNPAEIARQLCAGGADVIQLRAKEATASQVEDLAKAILPVTREAEVLLVINDHPAIACKIGAELCHLGQEDFFDAGHTHISVLQSQYPEVQIGLSTHAPEQARKAIAAAPAYIAIGPIYATGTKPTAKPVTLEYVRWASANVPIPWFAIGGINLNNLHEVVAAGARRICVVSAILNAPDIAEACRAFKSRLP